MRIFDLWVIRSGQVRSKNGHQKDICHGKIGLHVENLSIVLGSIVNITEDSDVAFL